MGRRGAFWIFFINFNYFMLPSNAFLLDSHGTSSKQNVCLIKECLEAAERINRFIDYDIDPCDDFYHFACGRWMKETPLPANQTHEYSSFGKVEEEKYSRMRTVLEETQASSSEPKSLREARILYDSCIDMGTIERRGDGPLKDFLTKEFGGWPLLTPDWKEDNIDLTDLLVQLAKINVHPIFFLQTALDPDYDKGYVLAITPSATLFSTPTKDGLHIKVLELMGVYDENDTRLVDELNDLSQLETEFNTLMMNYSLKESTNQDLYDDTTYPTTLGEFHRNYSDAVNFEEYVKSMFSVPEVDSIDISNSERIFMLERNYFRFLQAIIKDKPKRTVVNFLIWKFVVQYMNKLDSRYRKFANIEPSPVYEFCIETVIKYMSYAAGRMYLDKYSPHGSSKDQVTSMTREIKDSVLRTIRESPWLDDVTKEAASRKATNMIADIAYPESLKNDSFLDEYYSSYVFNESNFFENRIQCESHYISRNLRSLREPRLEGSTVLETVLKVGAFYNRIANSITIPSAVLQSPFFDSNLPQYLNYGGIGSLIAHEIGHGFDNEGRKYDSRGKSEDWWTQSVQEEYQRRSMCYVDQYSQMNITIEGKRFRMDGNKTLNENIADSQGLRQSHLAYRHWIKTQNSQDEQLLPNLHFNQDQLFFLSFGQLWCAKRTPEDAGYSQFFDKHSLNEARATGTAQNYEGFASAFNCPVGSRMNPRQKCSVWG